MTSEIFRVKVIRIPTNDALWTNRDSILPIYTGYGRFTAKHISEKICSYLNVKSKKCLMVHNRELYVYLDITGLRNLEPIGEEYRNTLLRNETLSIAISESEIWNLCLQSKDINLLKNSSHSTITYFVPRNSNYDIYNEEPFTANEEDPPLGYRDAYSHFIDTEI